MTADLTYRHGWAHYSLSVARALHRTGVDLLVIAPQGSPAIDDIDIHVPVYPILPTVDPLARRMLARQLALVPHVRRLLRTCDAVHSAVELFAPLAALAAGRRPLVITGHGTYVRLPRRPFPSGAIYRWAFQRGTLACVSRYTAGEARRALPGVRTVVIPNGIDADRFASVEPVPHPHPTVISVGAVKARKGTLPLIRALARVRTHVPDVRAYIVGSLTAEPDYVRAVQAEIDRLELSAVVRLTGRIDQQELLALYAQADVFALPSVNVDGKFEGYGLALLEASAAGLPVIGSRDCGAEDAIVDGETGLLVPQARGDQPDE
ncbi:MAG: glycosyltransferase family 4 protein, partial [Anaerolinea sp.]|nr:glycosyltransferase family 4 protein [Anaerolinea sp.]